MKIEFFGHACFRMTTKSGTSITFDPFTQIGYELPAGFSSSLVVCSHKHFDHAYTDGVKSDQVIFGEGEYVYKDVKIIGYKTFHDDVQGKKRGENTVFVVEADGLRICHLGDFGEENIGQIQGKLCDLDVLCIPIGGTYTIDGKQAKKIVDVLQPKYIIPMHYKTPDLAIEIADEKEFLSFFEQDEILKTEGVWEYPTSNKKIIRMERKR